MAQWKGSYLYDNECLNCVYKRSAVTWHPSKCLNKHIPIKKAKGDCVCLLCINLTSMRVCIIHISPHYHGYPHPQVCFPFLSQTFALTWFFSNIQRSRLVHFNKKYQSIQNRLERERKQIGAFWLALKITWEGFIMSMRNCTKQAWWVGFRACQRNFNL